MTNQREDKELCPWMAPLLKMTAEHVATAPAGQLWPWINRLTPREMARLLMRLLMAREEIDLRPVMTDRLLTHLSAMWPVLTMGEQKRWEPMVLEARTRSLTARGALPPASTGAEPTGDPTT